MGKQEMRVSVNSGKYTFIIPADDYRVSILRYGEPWHGPQGEASNALYAMMAELDAARVVVQVARELVECWRAGAQARLETALARHNRLVDDHEPPSAWCGGAVEHPPEPPPRGYLTDARIAEIAKRADAAVERVELMTSISSKDLQLLVGELQRRRGHDGWVRPEDSAP